MGADFPDWLKEELIHTLRESYVPDPTKRTPKISVRVNREPQKQSPYGQHESYDAVVDACPSGSWLSAEWTTGDYSRGNRWELRMPVEDILFLAAWILKNKPSLRDRSAWEAMARERVEAAAKMAEIPRDDFNQYMLVQEIADFIEASSMAAKVSVMSDWSSRKK